MLDIQEGEDKMIEFIVQSMLVVAVGYVFIQLTVFAIQALLFLLVFIICKLTNKNIRLKIKRK